MTGRFLHIGFMFPGVPKVRDLEPVFAGLGDWVRYSQTSWLLWTDKPSVEVLGALMPALDQLDNVFISAVDGSDFIGRQPNWIWDWMQSKLPGEVIDRPSLATLFVPNPPKV